MADSVAPDTLDPKPSEHVVFGKDNRGVATALRVLEDNLTEKNIRDKKDQLLVDEAERGFECDADRNPEYITSKTFYQIEHALMSIMKALDYQCHGVQRPEYEEMIVNIAVDTVLQRGGFYAALFGLQNGKGAMKDAGTIGNGYVLIQSQLKGVPVKYIQIQGNNCFGNARATSMRGGSKPQGKFGVLLQYPLGVFNRMYPDFADKVGPGFIPTNYKAFKDLDQTYVQKLSDEEKYIVEVCHFFDISNMAYVVFAGKGCTVLKEQYGEDYPFKFKDVESPDSSEEAFIPVLHFGGLPSSKGFFRHGLWELLYDVIMQKKRLMNKVIGHTHFEADGISIFSVQNLDASEIFGQIKQAQLQRAQGKRGVVVVESEEGVQKGINAQPLSSPINVSQVQFVDQWLDREIKRCGIALDELLSANVSATQVLSEEDNNARVIKQMLEYNSEEYKFAVRVTLAMIRDMVQKNDKTPIYSTTTLKIKNGEMLDIHQRKLAAGVKEQIDAGTVTHEQGVEQLARQLGSDKRIQQLQQMPPDGQQSMRMDEINLGYVKEVLHNFTYFVKVNSRSGANTPRLLRAGIDRLLTRAQPGSKAQGKLFEKDARLEDMDLEADDFFAPAPAAAPAAPGGAASSAIAPGLTEAIRPSPRGAPQAL